MSCCIKYYKEKNGFNFGEYPHCGILELPFIADQSGQHILHFKHGCASHRIVINGVKGQKLLLDLSCLNESSEVCFHITNPDGKIIAAEIKENNASPCLIDQGEEVTNCYFLFYLTTVITLINQPIERIDCSTFELNK